MMRLIAALLAATLLSACGAAAPTRTGSTSEPSPTQTPTQTPSPTQTPTPASSPAPVPTVAPTHGGVYWAVYLAAGDPGSQAFKQRRSLLEDNNLPHEGSDANCDQGSREALGLTGENDQVIGLYFASEADARGWAPRAPVTPVGIAQVTTYCLD